MHALARRRALALLVAGVAAVALACGSPAAAPPSPTPAPTGVLWLVSDSLRADVLDCYGGPARTPNICSLGARGVRFERAYANAPWTLPSTVSMFTGVYPLQYRRLQQGRDGRPLPFYYVEAGERLLGEALEEGGWTLRAYTENTVANRSQAMQGFARANRGGEPDLESRERLRAEGFAIPDDADLRSLWLTDALAGLAPDERFVLLHWFDDPHAPYRPLGEVAPETPLPRPPEYYRNLAHTNDSGRIDLREVAGELTAAEVDYLRRLYVAEVEEVDERVGWLLAALERSGRRDRTLVLFTSDHGEEFGEHGGFLHDHAMWDELVRVPLLVAGPGVAAGRAVAAPVAHVDLVPTLADLLGVPGFDGLEGRSLRRELASGESPRRTRPYYLSSPILHHQDAVVWDRYKLVVTIEGDTAELYDLVADPAERRDLAAERPEVVAQLRRFLAVVRQRNDRLWEARRAGEDPAERERILRETEQSLRAIGYI
jgi:arylsulfatase A-like enzyme